MKHIAEAHHSDPLLIAYLAERQLWLTQLRWIAIGGILGAVTVAARSGLITRALPLLLVVAFMGIYNLIFWRLSKANSNQVSALLLQKRVFLQVLLDLGALTTLLHLAGGVENPFVLFFAFHMAIAAMLLPLKMALYLGIAASVFHGASVFAEFAGVLAHHPLRFAPSLSDSSLSGMIGGSMDVLLCPMYRQAWVYLDVVGNIYSASSSGSSSPGGLASLQGRL